MEEFNISNTSQDKNSSFTYDFDEEVGLIIYMMTGIIVCIGLPLTLLAIYAVYSLVKYDHVVPVYVINLLISDLIQLCCMIVWLAQPEDSMIYNTVSIIYNSGLGASVGFMVCIALERYLVITCPLWYRFRRTIKVPVLVCVVVWVLSLICLITLVFLDFSEVTDIISAIFFLLPFPLFIFFLCGTLRALSASISVQSDEKRRIVGMLVLVLLIYTLLFLPSVILLLAKRARYNDTFSDLSFVSLRLSPLADLIMYIFMRKGTIDKLLAAVCCCKMDSNEISSSTV